MFYWAYGSNLNASRMLARCPGAEKVGPLSLRGAQLVFRRVADVYRKKDAVIHGGLWEIKPWHVGVLDRVEGVKRGVYKKNYIMVEVDGCETECFYYSMIPGRKIAPPEDQYIRLIADGYLLFGLPQSSLIHAINRSYRSRGIGNPKKKNIIAIGTSVEEGEDFDRS